MNGTASVSTVENGLCAVPPRRPQHTRPPVGNGPCANVIVGVDAYIDPLYERRDTGTVLLSPVSIFLLCKIDIYSFDMLAGQARYDIDPSCASAHMECYAHIECRRHISKIPLGIYIERAVSLGFPLLLRSEVEGSTHRFYCKCHINAKILRCAQDDIPLGDVWVQHKSQLFKHQFRLSEFADYPVGTPVPGCPYGVI